MLRSPSTIEKRSSTCDREKRGDQRGRPFVLRCLIALRFGLRAGRGAVSAFTAGGTTTRYFCFSMRLAGNSEKS
jgi:hypothetical protein